MKNLELLYHRAKTAIDAPHYQPFLDMQDREHILQVQKKRSITDLIALLRQIALKAIQKLRQSNYFFKEDKWQAAFALYEEQLQNPRFNSYQLCIVLCNVDDLIEIASVMQAVRKDILDTAKQQSTLSEIWEHKYVEIQKNYLQRREAILTLEHQVRQIGQSYLQFTGQADLTAGTSDFIVTQSVPRELPNYHRVALQTRFSEDHVKHLIQVEGSARTVYQDLAHEIPKPTLIEKLSHEIQSGQQRLNHKAENILKTADDLRQKIRQNSCRLIDHRAQATLAHANRIEQLSISLEKIIQLLNQYLSHFSKTERWFATQQNNPLILLVNQAKVTQDHLQQLPKNVDAQQVQRHVLAMEQHRKDYAKTLTGWSGLFGKNSKAHRQHEKLNQTIQRHITELIIPTCGLQDYQGITTVEQIRKHEKISQQLTEPSAKAHQEIRKIEEIGHEFNTTRCQF